MKLFKSLRLMCIAAFALLLLLGCGKDKATNGGDNSGSGANQQAIRVHFVAMDNYGDGDFVSVTATRNGVTVTGRSDNTGYCNLAVERGDWTVVPSKTGFRFSPQSITRYVGSEGVSISFRVYED